MTMSNISHIRGWCLGTLFNSKRLGVRLNFIRDIHRNYYDSLGLTPKASQAAIKQAYYKLSLKYHPDKTTGESERFREINAAYEVLGNLKLRKLYDKGALYGSGHLPPPEYELNQPPPMNTSSFEARTAQQRAPSTGRTREFNYDDWAKNHYGKLFEKDEKRRQRMAAAIDTIHKSTSKGKKEFEAGILIFLFFLVMLGGTLMMVFSTGNLDTPRKKD